MATVAEHLVKHAGNTRVAIRFEDQEWTWDEYVRACAQRAAYLVDHLPAGAPPHVGVLLDNTPEYLMWLGATALTGTVLVGINPTRRGAELARDITHTDCQIVVTEERHLSLLDGLDLGDAHGHVLVVDEPDSLAALDPYADAPPPETAIDEGGIYNLLFTSGTSGAPKACVLSQRRLVMSATVLSTNMGLTDDDVFYMVMPLFHSNAVITAFCPWVLAGATAAVRRRFSASGFLPDVRRYGATYVNYVGKPLSYVLATPEQPDDADNPLRIAFGNEAADLDIDRFAARFGCAVVDGYGSTEGGANVTRSDDMPKGALGMPADGIVVLDPDTLVEMPRAVFDAQGRLLNPDECIGEIVNKNGARGFEGYYNNDEANAQRIRHGWYWTGDLGYRDDAGYMYFGGRDFEWIRVDGENFAAAPIERILARHASVVLAAVFAVPDEEVGDQVMATILVKPGTEFDPEDFDEFLGEQTDLGTKWSPRYVRVTEDMPVTESQKPVKRQLRRERWDTTEPVFWRPGKGAPLQRMTDADRAALHAEFERHGRLAALDVG
ncbi:MAG: AMP-binding protein [Actinobacteria bacterium]|nr:AMP-binding protein [Actinomycetota bacterium]